MKLFRIERKKYFDEVLSGKGASYSNENRWNSLGTSLIYTSENRSLALLEILVHLDLRTELPKDRLIVELEIPDESPFLDIFGFSIDFKNRFETQKMGDYFIKENKHLLLKVPSAITPEEFNFLINPNHADAKDIKIVKAIPLIFDNRFKFQ